MVTKSVAVEAWVTVSTRVVTSGTEAAAVAVGVSVTTTVTVTVPASQVDGTETLVMESVYESINHEVIALGLGPSTDSTLLCRGDSHCCIRS